MTTFAALGGSAIAVDASAKTAAAVPTKWIGLCIRTSAPDRRISEVVLAHSSGDDELDRRMQADVIGMPAHGHTPLGEWAPFSAAYIDAGEAGAHARPGTPSPEFDCDKVQEEPSPGSE